MKRYLAVFTGTPGAMTRWEALAESERQRRQAQGVAAWKKWASHNAAAIVEMGAHLVAPSWWRAAGLRTFATILPPSLSSRRSLRKPPRGCF